MKGSIDDTNFWLKLLAAFCPDYLYEEIEGDLLQKFRTDIQQFGKARAKRRFIKNTLRFFRPGIVLRNTFSLGLNQGHMISSYLKIMFRNMIKRKLYTAINIAGLTVAIAFALVISAFIQSELSVNQDLPNADRLFMVESNNDNNVGSGFMTPGPLLPQVAAVYPEKIEGYYRFWDRMVSVSKGDRHFRVQAMIGDTSFLKVFGFKTVSGDAVSALTKPNTMILTEHAALQFFDHTNVAGEYLTIQAEDGSKTNFEIAAVISEPQPKNTVTDLVNMHAGMFLSFANEGSFSFQKEGENQWGSDLLAYVKLFPGVSPEEMTAAFNSFLKKNAPPAVIAARSMDLKPLTEYYQLTNKGAVINLLITLGTIMLFVVVLAICNFINISVAVSTARLKETGVRKVIGGLRKQVVVQFLAESMMFSFISGVLALAIYAACRNYASGILGADLGSITQFGLLRWAFILGSFAVIGLLAGIYPSFYLSAAKPVDSLKGKFKSVNGTIQFSRALIGIQFLVSVFIFIGTFIMSRQISYFLDKDLGYDKQAILVVTSVPRLWTAEGYTKVEAAKKEFLQSRAVASMALSTGSPSLRMSMGGVSAFRAGTPQEKAILADITGVDDDFSNVYGLKMMSGSFFGKQAGIRAKNCAVINETARKALQVELGDRLKFVTAGDIEFTVTGVVHDFNSESLHVPVKPAIYLHSEEYLSFRYFSIKFNPGNLAENVREVEAIWRNVFPEEPFVASFADANIENQYKTELQLKKASSIATALMLVIVLTGVLGLVSLNVAKRSKEIGIRKILGASAFRVLSLLSREYAIVMSIAFVIGVPLSYIFMRQWVNVFAYHINLEWWMFALPVVMLFLLTIVVVAIQSVTAALANPVKSLRQE